MPLICLFTGLIQDYSPYHPQIEAQLPEHCLFCDVGRLNGKGCYDRQVWLPNVLWIKVRRLRCKRCGTTIGLLPSFCVPFKRYAGKIIESCLTAVLQTDEPLELWCERHSWTDRRTAGAWVRQFAAVAGLLATRGAQLLGLSPATSRRKPAACLWAALRRHFGTGQVLCKAQVALAWLAPPLGMFRLRL